MIDRISRAAALRAALAASITLAGRPVRAQATAIRIGIAGNDSQMQPHWAADTGLFRQANLSVEIMAVGSTAAVPAVAGGTIDVGMADPIQLALAIEHAIPIAYFAGGPLWTTKHPSMVLCVAKNSPIRSLKDVAGKTVAIESVRSLMQIATTELLRKNGADDAKVKFFEMHFPEMAPALARGTVDVALIGEPFLTESKADLRTIGAPFDMVAPSFNIIGWFARRDWLDGNADLAHRLATVFYDTARWVNTHPDESAAIEAKYTQIDPAVTRTMARKPLATALRAADIQPVLDLATRYALLDRPWRAADLIAPGFV